MVQPELLPALRQYFGYSSFRPLQEEIIRETLAQRDVFALLPTGGGKSLCYQLPALLRPGLTVVVSPLIALMKDQVDGLQANGIAATFLNSTLDGTDVRLRKVDLNAGRCKLLYVAPERLMLSEFLEQLRQWRVGLFAIDEAHCISEWGHDFRPEYRQLARLREIFPGVPMAVFTATATQRVRQDIVEQLRLHEPRCFVASFNRPNLIYRVLPRRNPDNQVWDVVRRRPQDSGIVYCLARQTTENVAAWLRENGVKARAYHAGLSAEERSSTQELFRRDEVQVICATIAFGMGVNKSNVRFVIHYDLPKNIESYYQETGRAGRDGLPSECLLLFSGGDVGKLMRFIDDKENAHEAEIARKQLWKMVEYAQSGGCRRIPLLQYFGETFSEPNCQACDECLEPREQYDGTLVAQKFMSCIFRIKQRAPEFGAGVRYVADVLRGESSAVIERWRHHELSTFGIGKELSREGWMEIARELQRLGFVREVQEAKYTRVELTEEGQKVLSSRQPIKLSRPQAGEAGDEPPERGRGSRKTAKAKAARGEIECDEALFERLRGLRKRLADEREVPAFVVFSDATLREMARAYPKSDAEFADINGVGEKKLHEFAGPFLAEIKSFLRDHEPRQFNSAPTKPICLSASATARATIKLHDAQQSVPEIARQRGLTEDTIWDHLTEAAQGGEKIDLSRFLSGEQKIELASAFAECKSGRLKEVFERLREQFPYGLLRLFRARQGE